MRTSTCSAKLALTMMLCIAVVALASIVRADDETGEARHPSSDSARESISVPGLSPNALLLILREYGIAEVDARDIVDARFNEKDGEESLSAAALYWILVENGVPEIDAYVEMTELLALQRLRSCTHPGPIYWTLLELGVSPVDAENILHLSTPTNEDQFEAWRAALTKVLSDFGISERDAEQFLPEIEIAFSGTLCEVNPIEVLWCEGLTRKKDDDHYIDVGCWDAVIQPCSYQTCKQGDALWYSVTFRADCIPNMPSTCARMKVGPATWIKCSLSTYLTCEECIDETDCADIEAECCAENGTGCGCADCN